MRSVLLSCGAAGRRWVGRRYHDQLLLGCACSDWKVQTPAGSLAVRRVVHDIEQPLCSYCSRDEVCCWLQVDLWVSARATMLTHVVFSCHVKMHGVAIPCEGLRCSHCRQHGARSLFGGNVTCNGRNCGVVKYQGPGKLHANRALHLVPQLNSACINESGSSMHQCPK